MSKYHPQGELAPRDVVARAIAHELAISHAPDPTVYLDMTHLSGKRLDQRFPRIYATCLQYNIDISTDLIPIRPAAHYAMGGVRTDLDGRTSLLRLYAAGEVACTGVHGANRLASNSLLEGLVYGARAARAMSTPARENGPRSAPRPANKMSGGGHAKQSEKAPPSMPGKAVAEVIEKAIREVREVMWREAGIVRNGPGLRRAIEKLQSLEPCLPTEGMRRSWEARNMVATALLIARSALAREESRGAHYRTDFPVHQDATFLHHSIVRGEKIRFA
jgi:L-aspartate oxidase